MVGDFELNLTMKPLFSAENRHAHIPDKRQKQEWKPRPSVGWVLVTPEQPFASGTLNNRGRGA